MRPCVGASWPSQRRFCRRTRAALKKTAMHGCPPLFCDLCVRPAVITQQLFNAADAQWASKPWGRSAARTACLRLCVRQTEKNCCCCWLQDTSLSLKL